MATAPAQPARGYAVVVEPTGTGYSAYAPDLPGCVTTGRTLAEVQRQMAEALALHLAGMRADGESIPEPTATAALVVAPADLPAPPG